MSKCTHLGGLKTRSDHPQCLAELHRSRAEARLHRISTNTQVLQDEGPLSRFQAKNPDSGRRSYNVEKPCESGEPHPFHLAWGVPDQGESAPAGVLWPVRSLAVHLMLRRSRYTEFSLPAVHVPIVGSRRDLPR